MGGRDHSYECVTCGQSRGGMNDERCLCPDPVWPAGAEFTPFGPILRSCDFCGDEGCRDDDCDYCHGGLREMPETMRTLAHNLAWAATLCRSYEMGANPPPVGEDLHIAGGVVPAADWRPGHAIHICRPIGELIDRSSLGAGMREIEERGIDAHLADLERGTRRRK